MSAKGRKTAKSKQEETRMKKIQHSAVDPKDQMQRMAISDVLISGVGGLGVEIAKNLILGGVKSVTLHDNSLCKLSDLSSHFYVSEADLGKKRAKVSLKRLAELNQSIPVQTFTGKLNEKSLKKYRVVILTNSISNRDKPILMLKVPSCLLFESRKC